MLKSSKFEEAERILTKEFEPKDIDWIVKEVNETGTRGLALPYLKARAIQDVFDQAFTPFGWKNEYREWMGQSQLCGISVRINYDDGQAEWVTKWDGAEKTSFEPIKGGLADSQKRCAVQWRVGRYLYYYPKVWVDVEATDKSRYRIKEYEYPRLEAFLLSKGTDFGDKGTGNGSGGKIVELHKGVAPEGAVTKPETTSETKVEKQPTAKDAETKVEGQGAATNNDAKGNEHQSDNPSTGTTENPDGKDKPMVRMATVRQKSSLKNNMARFGLTEEQIEKEVTFDQAHDLISGLKKSFVDNGNGTSANNAANTDANTKQNSQSTTQQPSSDNKEEKSSQDNKNVEWCKETHSKYIEVLIKHLNARTGKSRDQVIKILGEKYTVNISQDNLIQVPIENFDDVTKDLKTGSLVA